MQGHKDVAESLIAKGANVQEQDKLGKKPLSLAVEAGHYEVVELLRAHGAKEDRPESEKIKDIK
jgi:ankyrin repeat protein